MKSTVPNLNLLHDLDSLHKLNDSTEKPRKANGDNDNVSVKDKKSLHLCLHEVYLTALDRLSSLLHEFNNSRNRPQIGEDENDRNTVESEKSLHVHHLGLHEFYLS